MGNVDNRPTIKNWQGLQCSSPSCLPPSVTDQLKLNSDAVHTKPTSRIPGRRGYQAASLGMLQNHHGENWQPERVHLGPRVNDYQTTAILWKQKGIPPSGFRPLLAPKPAPKTVLIALHYDRSQHIRQHRADRRSKP